MGWSPSSAGRWPELRRSTWMLSATTPGLAITSFPGRESLSQFLPLSTRSSTGHGETTNGFLRRISPVETNVVTSFNMNNMKVDAIVWKSFAGKKYGFTLTNDKFLLLAGDH